MLHHLLHIVLHEINARLLQLLKLLQLWAVVSVQYLDLVIDHLL